MHDLLAVEEGHVASSLQRRVRFRLAKHIGKTRPELFYYLADRSARAGVRVQREGAAINVVRPREREIVRIGGGNAVFVPLIVESFDYFFSSAEPVAEQVNGAQFAVVDFSTTRAHRIRGFDDFPIVCPSLTEPFVTTEQYLDFAQLKQGDVVLDLGAYSGLTSIAFSKIVGASGRVIACEPDPINFASAEANFASNRRVNGLDNVTLVPAAVSGRPGTLHLTSEGTMGSALTAFIGRHRGKTVEVEGLSLPYLGERFDLAAIDFIKMDIEGAELAAILESGDFFRRFRPRMIMETHLVEGVSTGPAVVRFLENAGYDCKVIKQHGLLSLPLLTAVPR